MQIKGTCNSENSQFELDNQVMITLILSIFETLISSPTMWQRGESSGEKIQRNRYSQDNSNAFCC